MEFSEKKEAILHFLERGRGPVRLKDILAFLGEEFKERTVRRWVEELTLAGTVEKKGRGKATHYRIAPKKQDFSRMEETSFFEGKKFESIAYIFKPVFERIPVSYNTLWFDSYEPNSTYYLSHSLREELYKKGVRDTNHDPAGTYAQHIYNRLLIDLSFNSSRLEGNTYSLLDTERLIFSGQGVEGKLDDEKIMILNHKDAIRFLVENAPRLQVELNTICTIHYLLSEGLVEPKYAGKVRDLAVRVSGSTYIPLEGSTIIQNQLAKIVRKASAIENAYEQAFFLLVHISYLQGFFDVNKRTARLAANIPFIVKNLVPLSFNDINRSDYMSAMMAIYELQDVRPLADLFAFSYERTCLAYDATVKTVGFDEVRVRYRLQRRALIRDIICKKLSKSKTFAYIEEEAKKNIPSPHGEAFIQNILDDLAHINQNTIGGLGITPDQLNDWERSYS